MTSIAMKPGASIVGISPEVSFGLVLIAAVFDDFGIPCVITSGTDGKHGANSLHYRGRALDLRLPSRFTLDTAHDEKVRRSLAVNLGEQWDVVLESDHLHLEFDPKTKQPTTEAT